MYFLISYPCCITCLMGPPPGTFDYTFDRLPHEIAAAAPLVPYLPIHPSEHTDHADPTRIVSPSLRTT